jgi:hypothetical protein
MIDVKWLLYLAVPATWTIFFSMFNAPGVRGWRNLGWPACYFVGVAMFWSVGWRGAVATWLSTGLVTGLLHYIYQAWSARGETDPAAKAQLSAILHGAVAWPIMLPEVIEYSLADAGVLRASTNAARERHPSGKKDGA